MGLPATPDALSMHIVYPAIAASPQPYLWSLCALQQESEPVGHIWTMASPLRFPFHGPVSFRPF